MKTIENYDEDDILLPAGVAVKFKHPDDVEDILYPTGFDQAQEDRKGEDLPPLMDD